MAIDFVFFLTASPSFFIVM